MVQPQSLALFLLLLFLTIMITPAHKHLLALCSNRSFVCIFITCIFPTVNKLHKVCSGCHEHIHIRCKKCPKCQTPCAIGRSRFQVEEDDLPPKAPSEMFHRMYHKASKQYVCGLNPGRQTSLQPMDAKASALLYALMCGKKVFPERLTSNNAIISFGG